MLHKQYDQIHNEMDIVKWYIEVLEGGFNTKTILKDFVDAQNQIKYLTQKLNKTKTKLERKLKKKK